MKLKHLHKNHKYISNFILLSFFSKQGHGGQVQELLAGEGAAGDTGAARGPGLGGEGAAGDARVGPNCRAVPPGTLSGMDGTACSAEPGLCGG